MKEREVSKTEIENIRKNGLKYRKFLLTRAKVLTMEDFKNYSGIIKTKEGEEPFVPGDFLAVGIEGEQWPINAQSMSEKIFTGEIDSEGFGFYESPGIVKAMEIDYAFKLRRSRRKFLRGKRNDLVVVNEVKSWPIDKEIFKRSYQLVIDIVDKNNLICNL